MAEGIRQRTDIVRGVKNLEIMKTMNNQTLTDKPDDMAGEKKTGLEEIVLDQPVSDKKRKRAFVWKMVLIVLGVVILLLVVLAGFLYYKKVEFYQTHFFPHVIINQTDCTDLDTDAVISLIEEQSRQYSLTVIGQNEELLGILTPEDVGLSIDVREDVEQLLGMQDPWRWILAENGGADYHVEYEIHFDPEQLKENVLEWTAFQKDHMESPQDAYLTEYLPEKKGYQIVPETQGSLLDLEKVYPILNAAVQVRETQVNLEEEGCYIRAKITSEDKALQKEAEILNRFTGTKITYDWNGEEIVLDGDTIHEWILEENGEYSIDEDAVAEFVAQAAKKNDTYGKKRSFITSQGVKLTLPSGGYGWRTDRDQETAELLELIQEGAVTEREPVYRNTAAHKGQNDIGSSYVEIDLTNQHLYLYIKGEVVLETDFVSGNVSKGNTTPPGVFGITYKTRDAVLRGATYETPVNYWMPFNGNIGMHDATWRAVFGGDIYLTDGSHGCINLPLDKAKEIYDYMSKGFPVVCYYY